MPNSSLESIHTELGYTPEDALALKKVRLVWQKLETARRLALKDPSQLRSYRDLLGKSLQNARQAIAVDPEAIAREYWDWYDAQCRELNIAHHESRRGRDHLRWIEKWQPRTYAVYLFTLMEFCELPSPRNLRELKVASTTMLRAYIEAFEDYGRGSDP
jgi:hypothetical protein